MSTVERCEYSELLKNQCGHCLGVTLDPDLEGVEL